MKTCIPEAITYSPSGVTLILVVAVSNLRSWINSSLRWYSTTKEAATEPQVSKTVTVHQQTTNKMNDFIGLVPVSLRRERFFLARTQGAT